MAEQKGQQIDEAISSINKRNKSMMVVVIAVALISLVGTGGTAAYLLLFKESAATAATDHKEGDSTSSSDHDGDHFNSAPDESAPLGPTYAMEDIVINLDGEDSNRYLKFSMVIEVDDEKTLEEVEARLPQIKDMTLTLVSSKTFADLQGADGKYRLREELRYRYNKLFKGRIGRLYFTNFVVQ